LKADEVIRAREGLAVSPVEFGFVFPEVHVGNATGAEDVEDLFCAAVEVRQAMALGRSGGTGRGWAKEAGE
jgi:hypothetical protein